MDKLNKLRLLAGLPVDLAFLPSRQTQQVTVKEDFTVPTKRSDLAEKNYETLKTRVDSAKSALILLTQAQAELKKIPFVDFSGDVVSLYNDIGDVVTNLKESVKGFEAALRKAKKTTTISENFEEISGEDSQGDTFDFDVSDSEDLGDETAEDSDEFETDTQTVEYNGKQYIVISDIEGSSHVALANPENESDIIVVAAEELDLGDDNTDDEVTTGVEFDLGDDEELDDGEDDEMSFDFGSDTDGDGVGEIEITSDEPVREGKAFNFYYGQKDEDEEDLDSPVNVAGKFPKTVWSEVQMKNDKNEVANQLDHVGAASSSDFDRKVKVPSSVKSAMKDAISEVEAQFPRLGNTESDAKFFYKNLQQAFEQIATYLEGGTVKDIKDAQIFMTTLMTPILAKIPAVVVNFIAKGGSSLTLKDYMKPVENYPIVGPRNTLK